jgi:hypothetical protein
MLVVAGLLPFAPLRHRGEHLARLDLGARPDLAKVTSSRLTSLSASGGPPVAPGCRPVSGG